MSGNTTVATSSIQIANRYLGKAPVDLEDMARALGISLDMNANLGPDVSGKIIRHHDGNNSVYEIKINEQHSPNRKRFTLAHEIAHFLLHKPFLDNGLVDNEMYRSGLGEQKEYEANRLAAEILMPASLVRTLWRAGARSVTSLSDTFGASDAAMRIRLEQLRLSA